MDAPDDFDEESTQSNDSTPDNVTASDITESPPSGVDDPAPDYSDYGSQFEEDEDLTSSQHVWHAEMQKRTKSGVVTYNHGCNSSHKQPNTSISTSQTTHNTFPTPNNPAQMPHPATVSHYGSRDASGLTSPLPVRKRNFEAHLDGDGPRQSASKSRRASPAPPQSRVQPSTTAALDPYAGFSDDDDEAVDLTGSDTVTAERLAEQQAIWDQIKQTRADEEVARRLAAHDVVVAPGPSTQHAGPVPSSQASANPIPSRNAFDRIYSRPTPQRNNVVVPTGQAATAVPSLNDGGRIPAYAAYTPPYTPAVPGAFPVDDNDDDDDDDLRITHVRPRTTPLSRTNTGMVFGAPSNLSRNGPQIKTEPRSAAALAREAALAKYGSTNDAPFTITSGYNQPSSTRSLNLPTTYNSVYGAGHSSFTMASPFEGYQPAQPFGSNAYASTSTNGMNGVNPLANIIRDTNSLDWMGMADSSGVGLSDQIRSYAQDVVDDPRKTQEEINELLANIRPDMDIPVEDRLDTPEALKYPLYVHQQLALQWMMQSEEGRNKGGILADDMGLGKTISTLALILSRPAATRNNTNLIVGPVALIKQWEMEIRKKIKNSFSLSVFLFHGTTATSEQLRAYDVVLTSYGTLAQQQKRVSEWKALNPGGDVSQEPALLKKSPLVDPNLIFHRVILDEAQYIKNALTLNSKGACAVNAKHRWCLTGTPMMNGPHELQSLIKFLRIRPYNNAKEFNKKFGMLGPTKKRSTENGRESAMEQLRILLKSIMLRRMKNSKIDGKPVLTLPEKTIEIVHTAFDADEQSFYNDLESKAAVTFSKYLRAGTVGKNYSNMLVLLLRLRQACCHPHLNLDFEYIGTAEVSTDQMTELAKLLPNAVVERLKREVHPPIECPICYDGIQDPAVMIPCGHNTCFECLTTLTERTAERDIQAGVEVSSARCPECRGPISANKVIKFSTFREVYMPETVEAKEGEDQVRPEDAETASDASDTESDGDNDNDANGKYPLTRGGNLAGFVIDDDVDDDDMSDGEGAVYANKKDSTKKSKKQSKRKSKGKGKEKKEEVKPHMLKELRILARKNQEEYRRYMRYLRKNWQPSAKVSKCEEILQQIRDSGSGERTIIFSQWTFLLDLLEVRIKHELKIKFRRYDGGMSRAQRDDALLDFTDPNSLTKILLVSLKAGNAGLNLTTANHVIIMDPFWNPYIEMQAVDRAHRIGQQRPVFVHRILIEGTVEDRIMELQEKKRSMVEAALDENSSKRLSRLTINELARLFNVDAHTNNQ